MLIGHGFQLGGAHKLWGSQCGPLLIKPTPCQHLVTYLVGDVGCGKSTQVPQFLLESGARRVVVTQPRRVAAVTLARRVAAERGEEVGQAVGYAIQAREGPPQWPVWGLRAFLNVPCRGECRQSYA